MTHSHGLRRARSLASVLMAGALLLALPAPAHADRTLAISSGSFHFELGAGHKGEGEVTVINDGDEPIKVLVYAADQRIGDRGEIGYETPNRDSATFGSTPASWFRIRMPEDAKAIGNTPYVELEPGQRVPVTFRFTAPSAVPPGDHNAVLFFEMFEMDEETGGAASMVRGRIGSRIRVRVAGEIIERFEVRPFVVKGLLLGDVVPYRFGAVNDGNVDQGIDAEVVLYDSQDREVASGTPFERAVVYARERFEASGTLEPERALFGKYTARLIVDHQVEVAEGRQGAAQRVVEERTFWAFPKWFAVAVGVTAALLLLLLLWRALTRAARRRARRELRETRGRRQRETAVDEALPMAVGEGPYSRRPSGARGGRPDERREARGTRRRDEAGGRRESGQMWAEDDLDLDIRPHEK